MTCDELGLTKTQPAIYHKTCAMLGSEPGATLFFDDKKGCALGSDGLVYAPVCRCPEGEDEDAEVIGWCAAAREVIL